MSRRSFLAGMAAASAGIGASTLLGGCADGSQSNGGMAGSGGEGGEIGGDITFYFGASSTGETNSREAVVAAFEDKYPDIKVTTQIAGADPLQELLTAIAGGTPPDVMMAWELSYLGIASRGGMLDLSSRIAADAALSEQLNTDGSPVLMGTFSGGDQQWALPEQFAGIFLYYNRRLFEEAGITPPSADWTDVNWNWDAFIEAAQQLTKTSDGKITQYGFVDAWVPYLSASVLAMGNGVDWFSPPISPTESNMDDPSFIAGWQFYADLANKYKVAPKPQDEGVAPAADLFVAGQAAMCLSGHWMYGTFAEAEDLDFDVAALPVGPNGKAGKSDIGATGLAIAAASKNPDAAWEFVKFSCGPEGQEIIAKSGLFVPILKSVIESEAFVSAHEQIENTSVFSGALDNAAYLPISPAWGKIEPLIVANASEVWQGRETAADFAARINPQIDELLETEG
ncbi:MAG: sugar ABC transporter substrate-binding protein [Bifidobacteriaceae bacterium]|jgi:multiple sugar transport system substrate-binding protein|nr:sugar ABC transporter substrate-binding protein [Bifidobacteriaceae bacterium]